MPNRIFIGDTGAELIFGEWLPGYDPETEARTLMRLANAVGDWEAPMVEARAAIMEDTRQHFATETDPDGKPWEELNEDYREQKLFEGYPDEILVRTGALQDAALSDAAYMITERDIMFNSAVLPFYGPYHQTGLEERLPKRKFVGVSEECENEVEAIFLNWLNDTTDVVYPPRRGPGSGGLGGAFGLGYGTSKLGVFSVYKVLPSGQPLLKTPAGGYMFGRGTRGGL